MDTFYWIFSDQGPLWLTIFDGLGLHLLMMMMIMEVKMMMVALAVTILLVMMEVLATSSDHDEEAAMAVDFQTYLVPLLKPMTEKSERLTGQLHQLLLRTVRAWLEFGHRFRIIHRMIHLQIQSFQGGVKTESCAQQVRHLALLKGHLMKRLQRLMMGHSGIQEQQLRHRLNPLKPLNPLTHPLH